MTVDLAPIWASLAREAFRLELLQSYSVPSEEARIRAWQEGQPPADTRTAWQEQLIQLTARDLSVRRVHVVDEPLTEYLRWEIAGYQRNARYGEQIRILPRQEAPELPDHDFWLMDDEVVVLMHYDDEGRLTGRELFTGDPAPYVAARESAWAYAQPVAAWCKPR